MRKDILLIHVPKFNNYYRPINRFSFILYHPIGLLGLVDFAEQNGLSSLVVDLGVEKRKRGSIDITGLINRYDPDIIGLSLHFHFQSYDVIEVAKQIKSRFPNIPIVLGGFTASYFAEEIMHSFPFIDYVIRGDAEIPLVWLTQCVKKRQEPREVPNLVYRRNSHIVRNANTYVATQDALDRINFTRFESIKDFPDFFESLHASYFRVDGISRRTHNLLFGDEKVYPVYMGRGCLHNCSYCGGGVSADRLINNRVGVVLRSAEKIAESVRNIEKAGFHGAALFHDMHPPNQADTFYGEIFDRLRTPPLSIAMEVERYNLPSEEFIRRFKETFSHHDSFISLSPSHASADIRRKNNVYRYSNEDLERCLAMLDAYQVKSLVSFALGLPFESREDIALMIRYQRSLRKRFKYIQMRTCLIEVEPCSELSRNPATFHIELNRRTFMDYYRYHSDPNRNHKLERGYSGQELPDLDFIRSSLCKNFCLVFKAGFLSPILCKAAGFAWKCGLIGAIDKMFIAQRRS